MALLYKKLEKEVDATAYLEKAHTILQRNEQKLIGKNSGGVSFYLSETGILTLGYIVKRMLGKIEAANENLEELLDRAK